ncbi:hypothetical protein M1N61_01530 [Peptococcaceae bacterium]|nr:hypothetical protein [Peptococcaceae bacterium]
MITASRDIFYNVMMGEWKGLDIRVLQILGDGKVYSKTFTLEELILDEVEACQNCSSPAINCEDCDGVVEVLALVGFVKINKRKVEEGAVVPLIGDVLFDLRENHVVILSDSDITVVSRAHGAAFAGEDDSRLFEITKVGDVNDVKVGLRMYLMTENKIKRLAIKALHDGRVFKELAGKKAIAVEVTYAHQNKKVLYLRSLRLFNVYFDEEGYVDKELTFPKQSVRQNGMREKYLHSKVIELEIRDKEPELTKAQKEALKERLLKDFGESAWENTPVRIKALLE